MVSLTRILVVVAALALAGPLHAKLGIAFTPAPGSVALIVHRTTARIIVDSQDDPAVAYAAAALRNDLAQVSTGAPEAGSTAIIIGTIGHSAPIDALIAAHKLDVRGVTGRWEAFVQQVVSAPAPGVARALVIAGADRRGTVFGVYDVSARIGVSPWQWWADVPVQHHAAVFARGRGVDAPVVKYRGIFINDEEPALGSWAREKFGGINAKFYAHVYDLILRLKGNYLWPAMWGKSLWQDDPESATLANQRGVVLGTSHHEPLMRAHVEWQRSHGGAWDYTCNAEALRAFWRAGLERTRGNEQLVTIGMRGDGDEPMMTGTAIPLLERIVADQRQIIADVSGKPPAATPQVWALYKEVQAYYDQGMRVPDDVTLLFSDDNWGNLRRLPAPHSPRAGGYGVYYHFDYVGDPRNYKWLNSNQIERIWQQMDLAHAHGADQLWIANVGDIKPMELPISFFLDMAWNPARMSAERLPRYYTQWAAQQFGAGRSVEIGHLIATTTRLNAQMKPELIDTHYYADGNPLHRPTAADYAPLMAQSARIAATLPADQRDAFYELVVHPIAAMANLHRLYWAAAGAPGSRSCAQSAHIARDAFAEDSRLRARYEGIAQGKWHYMMAQTHIGYTGWQEPPTDVMPALPDPATAAQHCAHQPAEAPTPDGAQRIDAPNFAAAAHVGPAHWAPIPNLGLWSGAVTVMPQAVASFAPGAGPRLDYTIAVATEGPVELAVLASPALDVRGDGQLRYAVALDDAPPQVVNLLDGNANRWANAVAQNIRIGSTRHIVTVPGRHTLHLWAIDPNVTVQRLIVTPAHK